VCALCIPYVGSVRPAFGPIRCGADQGEGAASWARTAASTRCAALTPLSCSLTRITVQPAARSPRSFRWSRRTLASSFARHQSPLATGRVAWIGQLPEAPVYEDGYACAGEDQIGPATQTGDGSLVDAVARGQPAPPAADPRGDLIGGAAADEPRMERPVRRRRSDTGHHPGEPPARRRRRRRVELRLPRRRRAPP